MTPELLDRLTKLEKAASAAPWDMDCLDARDADLVHCVMYDSDQAKGKAIFDTANAEDRLITDESDEDGPHYRDDVAFNNFLFIRSLRNHAKELLAMAKESDQLYEHLANAHKDNEDLRKVIREEREAQRSLRERIFELEKKNAAALERCEMYIATANKYGNELDSLRAQIAK